MNEAKPGILRTKCLEVGHAIQEAFQEEAGGMPPLPQELQAPTEDPASELLLYQPQDAGGLVKADASEAESMEIDPLVPPGRHDSSVHLLSLPIMSKRGEHRSTKTSSNWQTRQILADPNQRELDLCMRGFAQHCVLFCSWQ